MSLLHSLTSLAILPRIATQRLASLSPTASLLAPLYSTTNITLPAISLNIPDILSDIWEGVLRAVPKKKTSHMKKRHRQLAGKALKDVMNLNACPSCGEPKRAHYLCQKCVDDIRRDWSKAERAAKAAGEEKSTGA